MLCMLNVSFNRFKISPLSLATFSALLKCVLSKITITAMICTLVKYSLLLIAVMADQISKLNGLLINSIMHHLICCLTTLAVNLHKFPLFKFYKLTYM